MMHIPSFMAVNAAESRLVESKRKLHQSAKRTQSALTTAIARPSTLVLVAVASGVSGFLFAPRCRPAVKSVSREPDATIRTTSHSLGRMLISMFGARALAIALQLGANAVEKSGWCADAKMPGTPATGATSATASAEPNNFGPVPLGAG